MNTKCTNDTKEEQTPAEVNLGRSNDESPLLYLFVYFVFKLSEIKALYRVRGPVLRSFGHIYSVEVYPPSTGTAMPVT